MHFLERGELMDDWGGSEVLQMTPARIELSQGADQLACVRLSPKGLMRWYARCCSTPIANTMASAGMAFAGVLVALVDLPADAHTRDEALGPMTARVNGRARLSGVQGAPKLALFPLLTIARALRLMIGGKLRGEHQPSPFFDEGGAPRVTPQVLSESERDELRARLPTYPRG